MESKIIRKVTEIGNGAHIFAPKEWLDEEVVIIRVPRKNPKEEILKLVYPNLDKVMAVFLFGSYARNEQEKDSDIDILIIASEKFKVNKEGIDVIVIPECRIEKAKKLNPILFYSMLQEAIPILNSSYLEKLKQDKIKLEHFKGFLKDTKYSLESNKELMEMDKKLNNKNASESVVYSLLLRLRGIFIINLLLNREKYSKELFKKWLVENSGIDYEKVYKIYRAVRDNKKTEEKILITETEPIMNLLIKETEKLSKRLK